MVKVRFIFPCLALGLLCACGGGGGGGNNTPPPPQKATGLSYSDPSSGDFRLVKDNLSTRNKIILNLVSPVNGNGRGVAFTFTVDSAKAILTKVAEADTEYVQNGVVLNLGGAPQLIKGIKQDGTLRVTVTEKGSGNAKPLNGVVARIAIQFKPDANLNTGAFISIGVTEGQYLPALGAPQVMNVNVGNLTTQ
ncbi:MAG: hypothetical protein IPP78_15380 [Holophagaceae bacterium]|nr:hypothetical protein [Holophagaceae bacterium]